jgi:hypothetical protein
MNVNEWGPGLWVSLHCMVLNYPIEPTDEDKIKYKNYFKSLQGMLPCKYCRNSYEIYFKYLPIDNYLDSRNGMCYWLYTLHNLVNEKVCKPCVSFKHSMEKYEQMRARCGKIKMTNQTFGSCQKKVNENSDLNEFVKETEEKYKPMTDKYLEIFKQAPENPNKKNKNLRYRFIKSSP